jgi:NADH dehydrogenase
VIVGAGLTGIETAAEMPGRLRTVLATAQLKRPFHVILVDRNPWIGSDMGNSARPAIEQALRELGIEMRTGVSIASIDASGVKLESGTLIPAATVVRCAGMQANPLTRQFPVERDRFGRLPVDEFMKVKGVANVFAAGDMASAMMDDIHTSVMSCQHARPMGRFAGHNAVCDLLKLPMRPLRIEWYVTILDLGSLGGSLYPRVGTSSRIGRCRGQEDQANYQLPPDLPAAHQESTRNPRCCRTGGPDSPRVPSLEAR